MNKHVPENQTRGNLLILRKTHRTTTHSGISLNKQRHKKTKKYIN